MKRVLLSMRDISLSMAGNLATDKTLVTSMNMYINIYI